MQHQTSSLEDKGFVRALAFVESLACAKPAVILEIARKTVVDESRIAMVKSLDEALVAAARTVGVWHVKDAVQTALHPLRRLAVVTDVRAHEVRIAHQLACEAALALLADGAIPPEVTTELCRPFESLEPVDELETPSDQRLPGARMITAGRGFPAKLPT